MKQEAGSEFSEQLMFPRKYIGALMWHSGTSKSFALTFPVHLKRNCSFWCPDSTMVQLWQPNFFNDDQVELLPPNRHRVMWATLLGLEFDRSQMPNIREMQQKEAKMNIVSGIVVEVNGNVDLPSYFLCWFHSRHLTTCNHCICFRGQVELITSFPGADCASYVLFNWTILITMLLYNEIK